MKAVVQGICETCVYNKPHPVADKCLRHGYSVWPGPDKSHPCHDWYGRDEATAAPEVIEMSKLQCRNCGHVAEEDEWGACFVYCEVCGEHTALSCPACDHAHDEAFGDTEPIEVGNE